MTSLLVIFIIAFMVATLITIVISCAMALLGDFKGAGACTVGLILLFCFFGQTANYLVELGNIRDGSIPPDHYRLQHSQTTGTVTQ